MDIAIAIVAGLLGWYVGRKYQRLVESARRQRELVNAPVEVARLIAKQLLQSAAIAADIGMSEMLQPIGTAELVGVPRAVAIGVTFDPDLEDAEALHAEYPEKFELLPLADRVGLQVGDLVKICLHPEGDVGVRFFVIIVGRHELDDGRILYAGNATRDYDDDLREGRPFGFGPHHIYQIEHDHRSN